MPQPKNLRELIAKFKAIKDPSELNEATVSNNFIGPLFELLGWDIHDYHQVSIQPRIHSGNKSEAPDFGFCSKQNKYAFFVEAKKPSINIKNSSDAAFQLKRYAWTAGLPISILTDFEELSIYYCLTKPDKNDPPSKNRIAYFRYSDYEKNWNEIYSKFSYEAVLKGSLDEYAEATQKERGTQKMDEEFLHEIESWRIKLAEAIASNNLGITSNDLNEVVQTTIDRIIFLRICEGRNIESYGELKNIAENANVYKNLLNLFKQADTKYNSGLFYFNQVAARKEKPDLVSSKIQIKDNVLKRIIDNLYPPNSPYAFSVFPLDTLGQIYEKFLGKRISLAENGKIIIEEKPEIRKAGGVYYTPTYIVDYIVNKSLGSALRNKDPKGVAEVKIIDIACGSGSFLNRAYDYLLNWHENWYLNNQPDKYPKAISKDINNRWNLSLNEKKRILLNNIYGVDIDKNATEVTKLSLLLRILENEDEKSLSDQLHTNESALPDLGENIKCGNSIIESDIGIAGLNAFNWAEQFPKVMKRSNHGFDIVIGNPPYARIQTLRETQSKEALDYYQTHYESGSCGSYDEYGIFIEKGFNLLNTKGILGYIVPHKFIQSQFGLPLRNYIAKNRAVHEIVHFGSEQIFEEVTTYTCLLFLTKGQNGKIIYHKIDDLGNPRKFISNIASENDLYQSQGNLIDQVKENEIWLLVKPKIKRILEKICNKNKKLSEITSKIFQGIATSADKIYVLKKIKEKNKIYICYSEHLQENVEIEKGLLKPFLMGKDVKRYQKPYEKNMVIFPYTLKNNKAEVMDEKFIKNNFPKGWEYLLKNKNDLINREGGKKEINPFYGYIYPKNLTVFEKRKIITPEISRGCNLTIDEEGTKYHTTKVYSLLIKESIPLNLYFFLGILNSPVMWLFLKATGYILRGGFFTFKSNYLKPFPIPIPNLKNSSEKILHDRMVEMVKRLLKLNKELSKQYDKNLATERNNLENNINKLVYNLYKLTPEEQAIINQETQNEVKLSNYYKDNKKKQIQILTTILTPQTAKSKN